MSIMLQGSLFMSTIVHMFIQTCVNTQGSSYPDNCQTTNYVRVNANMYLALVHGLWKKILLERCRNAFGTIRYQLTIICLKDVLILLQRVSHYYVNDDLNYGCIYACSIVKTFLRVFLIEILDNLDKMFS